MNPVWQSVIVSKYSANPHSQNPKQDTFDAWTLIFEQREYIKKLEQRLEQKQQEINTLMHYETIWKNY